MYPKTPCAYGSPYCRAVCTTEKETCEDIDVMNSEVAHEIVPRLWLGNKRAASDETWLREHNVTVVFNCTKTLPFAESIRRLYRVPVDDNLEAEEITNLANWAAETQMKLVREYKAGRTILVHCHAGMQRSAAVVAMFLITMYGIQADLAMSYIKSKRNVAFFPSANFERAIRDWDMEIQKYRGTQQNEGQQNQQNQQNQQAFSTA